MDLGQKQYRKSLFAPAATMATYVQSPEFQQWAHPEALMTTLGAEAILGGTSQLGRQAYDQASQMGLGPGFAAQQATGSRQEAMGQLMQAVAQSRLAGMSRRATGAGMVAQAVREGQQAAMLRNMQRRAARKAWYRDLTGAGISALPGLMSTIFSEATPTEQNTRPGGPEGRGGGGGGSMMSPSLESGLTGLAGKTLGDVGKGGLNLLQGLLGIF
jgi:hypothetical protein